MKSVIPLRLTATVLWTVCLATGAYAQSRPPLEVSEARAAELVRQVLAQTASPAPTPAPAPPQGGTELRLDDAVRLALEKNLDIAVERLNPAVFEYTLAQVRANYQPTVASTLGTRSTVNLPTSQLNGGQRVQNDVATFNSSVNQLLPWTGGLFSVGWTNSKNETTNIFANFNPSYQSTITASLTQPLLRDFRIDSTRQQLVVTRLNRDISEIQLRATIVNTLAATRNAYWDLLYANRVLDVARQSLALAEKLVEDNKVRVEVGTLAPIDVVQAEAEAASRRQALAQAEAAQRTAELALKRLIVNGTSDPMWNTRIVPVDLPPQRTAPIDLVAAVQSALSKRTDLEQARRQLEVNDVSVRYLRNQTLPALDLVASYGLQGLGGTQYIRSGTGLGSTVIETLPGGYRDALSAIGRRNYPTWNVALNLSYPVGTSAADAQLARARVQLGQTQAQLRALELQVATEVTNAALQVESNQKRIEAARAARELAERRLEAEQSKFEVGMSTNFFVVQAQRDLADAQIQELSATLDYTKSLVEFERAQESSLSQAGVTLVTTGGGVFRSTGSSTGGGGTGGGGGGFSQ